MFEPAPKPAKPELRLKAGKTPSEVMEKDERELSAAAEAALATEEENSRPDEAEKEEEEAGGLVKVPDESER